MSALDPTLTCLISTSEGFLTKISNLTRPQLTPLHHIQLAPPLFSSGCVQSIWDTIISALLFQLPSPAVVTAPMAFCLVSLFLLP